MKKQEVIDAIKEFEGRIHVRFPDSYQARRTIFQETRKLKENLKINDDKEVKNETRKTL